MKKNAETMKEVASLCSKYCSCDDCGCKNSTSANASCQNCTHYDAKNVCDIDLYEEIVTNHNL
ncbi:MAG: hypothetical protein ACLUW4_06840 [Butyribacter sp.]|jgi:hypothetical protein|uniref:DUF1540 domain-containing protein n=1 Tax=Butyribacter intestini TaxID=1703332 RepID=A0AAW3JP44_9FIRM|nr:MULTISPECIES: hypothetical protein [Clostridia]MBS5364009.1 hypothetical protein [Clostridium sp.]MCQ5164566.1 hypothetical protein [Roseburia hominis]OKZ80147.1 MAG: hypothetical protein BHW08_07320 [Clostridium sp. CAG:12237_41]UYJ41966.1 MAG: hypothetical protein OGM15_06545 [Lachnospiraceae bacterium]CCZ41173.1 uncharacterized protein BN479_01330 [Clostridium sp. CAG:122]